MASLLPISRESELVLSTIPAQGEFHRWLARCASRLAASGHFSREEIYKVVAYAASLCTHRRIPEKEIGDAVAFGMGEVAASTQKKYTWTPPQPDLISEIIADSSPICNPAESTGLRPMEVLPSLLESNTFVCIGRDQYTAENHFYPDAWDSLDPSTYQYIVPNPMREQTALNNAGEPSARCINNVAHRRFLVVEFDHEPDKVNQAKLLAFLSEQMPCCLVVDSGGKSLHGWFYVADLTESEAALFFSKAVALGCDQTLYDLAKWVRMPGGLRNQKTRQRIVYFDEGAIEC